MKKTISHITIALALVVSLGLLAAPQPANAFTLFGIRFFEKPTPTPTVAPTPTPTIEVEVSPTPTVLGEDSDLPSTGPQENIALLLLAIGGGLIARKHIQFS